MTVQIWFCVTLRVCVPVTSTKNVSEITCKRSTTFLLMASRFTAPITCNMWLAKKVEKLKNLKNNEGEGGLRTPSPQPRTPLIEDGSRTPNPTSPSSNSSNLTANVPHQCCYCKEPTHDQCQGSHDCVLPVHNACLLEHLETELKITSKWQNRWAFTTNFGALHMLKQC